MKRITLLIFSLILITSTKAQIFNISENSWILDTKSMTYHIGIQDNVLKSFYYGPKLSIEDRNGSKMSFATGFEIPVRGNTVWGTPVVEAVFHDGVRDIELEYTDSEISVINNRETLKIRQKDNYYPLQIISYYRLLPEYDIIEKWIEISNTGNAEYILIENIQSGSLWLPSSNYELTHLSGALRNEFQPQVTMLTYGVKSVQAKDFKSYGAPYFAVRPAGQRMENNGDVWYGQLHYSGNWNLDFEKLPNGNLQIVGGIRFWDTSITLAPSESFKSPVFSFGYTQSGYEAVMQNYAAYISEELAPKANKKKLRPVIYNSWYATEFDVNEQQQMSLAKAAKEIGVEMFVIDDGWFKGRTSDRGGLGDWTVDKNKFPNGLNPLIKQINDLGMDFGIWVEPEMVNPDSDLFRTHPDWIFYYPNRRKTLGRMQHMLNLGREDVYRYLLKSLTDLLRNHNIKYLKWDMNRHLSEPGWPSQELKKQKEARIRHIQNLYRLIDTLKSEFPEVWFETCSSGGGRVDLGMLSRMDVSWASDNIDPLDRIFIQYAYLGAFPANTMVSWTGEEDWHKGNYSLEFRFDVAMNGVLGIGNDITMWSEKERVIAKEKIALYKKIRPLIHNGILYRLMSPYESNHSVLQFISPDKTEAVILCYNIAEQLSGSIRFPINDIRLRLRELDPEKNYIIDGTEEIFSGNYLINTGLKYPIKGIFTSKIIQIKQLQNDTYFPPSGNQIRKDE